MKYLYTQDQQLLAHKSLSKTFELEESTISADDTYIETIRNNTQGPGLNGEHHGMFNKKHKQSSKDLMSAANKGRVSVKDSDGKTFRIDATDARYISGELVGIATGKIAVKDKNGEKFLVDATDTRYISGELVGVQKGTKFKQKTTTNGNKGTFLAKDINGNKCRLTKEDPRYISGEFIHFRCKF